MGTYTICQAHQHLTELALWSANHDGFGAHASRTPVKPKQLNNSSEFGIPFGAPTESFDMGVNEGGLSPNTALLKNRLNTALTFENLIEGTANRMARAAAMHISHAPASSITHYLFMVA